MEFLSFLYENVAENFDPRMLVMWAIGGILIFLAIKKDMEPTLLLPIGFGAILVNLPLSGAVGEEGALSILYEAGIANELFPLLLFIGVGAMIDFGPILANPKLMIFGAAAQFGIFFTFCTASMFFDVNDAASIAIIGAADGPTSIVVAQALKSQYLGAIMVAAYSYMALVPIVQPPVIKLLTTKKERMIRMPYRGKEVSKLTRILFPIIITVVAGLVSPQSVALVGFLMFGNLIRECGVLNSLSETAQKRLDAIREFTEFGSGFRIAMRDLEIRGAGNLLGPEQSGYMMSVGYDMYLQLLEEAVLEQRGEKAPQRTECSADLTVSANLPESYIPSGEQRMDIYRRIAALRTAEQSQELLDELIDRYGEPPQPVLKLMDVALLRAEAVQIGVSDISQRGSEITFTFAASEAVPVEAVMALCSLPKNRRRLTLSATGTEPKLLLRLSLGEDALDTALTLVGDLRVNKEENEKEVTL